MASCCVWFFVLSLAVSSHGDEIAIGGLFHSRVMEQEAVFNAAVEDVNNQGILKDHELVAIQEQVPEMDAFQVGQATCRILEKGVAGIFGPQSKLTAGHVQSICDTKEVPHVETRWDVQQRRGGSSINLFPHPLTLTSAVMDVIDAWGWKAFNILYEEDVSLIAMGELVRLTSTHRYSIMLRQLQRGDNYRPVLRDIQESSSNNVILDCSLDILPEVLKQAQQVGIMVNNYNYIITNLDLQTVDLEFLMYGRTNITGFRMVDGKATPPNFPKDGPMLVSSALIHDAVHLFAHAFSHMSETNVTSVQALHCSAVDSWAHGYTLLNYLKLSEIKGFTGLIKFDHEGFRSQFELGLVELTDHGLEDIGLWNSTLGLNLTRTYIPPKTTVDEDSVANKSFIVLIALTHPYNMLKEDSKTLTGNDRYEGFGIDLIEELAKNLNFNVTFKVQADGAYGGINPVTGEWNGMLREIMDDRAHLAITDLTITHERESGVDFTMPFMNLGIQILYKKPTKEAPKLFSFLSPFSMEVWMYMLGAYIGVSVLLFLMARISPSEWTNPYPCIEEPDELINQFSLKNSLWFTIGSLMQQGSEIAPIAISTRMVAGIWWFFTLIMVSSYTANLAAFLTVENPDTPFENVKGLATNDKGIKWGAKRGGATAKFFTGSSHPIYQKMGEFMEENKDEVMPTSNDVGIEMVKNSKYAFLMESTSIEYTVQRNCDLAPYGGLLDSKGYGIAMKKNSPYRNQLSTGVLRMQESGRLSTLKDKWWKEKRGGGACTEKAATNDASELDLKNVGGVFVVLVGGVFIACFITIFEMIWNLWEVSRKENVSFNEELMEELRFISKFHGSTKPVRKRENKEEEGEGEDNVSQCEPLSPNNLMGWKLP